LGKDSNNNKKLQINFPGEQMQKSSIKYLQTKFNEIFKRSYIMMKLDSFQDCKDGSTYTNQEM
jgi:hypothetical protein